MHGLVLFVFIQIYRDVEYQSEESDVIHGIRGRQCDPKPPCAPPTSPTMPDVHRHTECIVIYLILF